MMPVAMVSANVKRDIHAFMVVRQEVRDEVRCQEEYLYIKHT
jgi:hypothetical protein